MAGFHKTRTTTIQIVLTAALLVPAALTLGACASAGDDRASQRLRDL